MSTDTSSSPDHLSGSVNFGTDSFFTRRPIIAAAQKSKKDKAENEVLSWSNLSKWQGLPDSHFIDKGKNAAVDETTNHVAQRLYDNSETQLLVGDLNAAEQGFSHIINYYSQSPVAYKARLGLAKVYDRRSEKSDKKNSFETSPELSMPGSSIQQLSIISLGSEISSSNKSSKSKAVSKKVTRNSIPILKTNGSKEDFQLNVGDRIFFDESSASLSTEAKKVLTAQAKWLKAHKKYRLLIEGHADEKGPEHYNMVLSANRAISVQNFFLSEDIDPGRITTKHFGKSKPVAICNKESCSVQNRRAVTKLIPESAN